MKVIILIDAKNFEQSIFNISRKRKEFRFIDFNLKKKIGNKLFMEKMLK